MKSHYYQRKALYTARSRTDWKEKDEDGGGGGVGNKWTTFRRCRWMARDLLEKVAMNGMEKKWPSYWTKRPEAFIGGSLESDIVVNSPRRDAASLQEENFQTADSLRQSVFSRRGGQTYSTKNQQYFFSSESNMSSRFMDKRKRPPRFESFIAKKRRNFMDFRTKQNGKKFLLPPLYFALFLFNVHFTAHHRHERL